MTNIYTLISIGLFQLIGLIGITVWQEKKTSKRLQAILYSILDRDRLAIKLESLVVKYEETANLPDAYAIFYTGVLQAISKSKISHMISETTINEFNTTIGYMPRAKYLCMEMIEQLRWDSLE